MLISRKLKTKSYTTKESSHITEQNYSMSNKEQKKEWCYHKLVQVFLVFFQKCGGTNVGFG